MRKDPAGRVCGVAADPSPRAEPLSKDEKDLQLLVYDNRYKGRASVLPRHLLYRSAAHLDVSLEVGSLAPATVRPFRPGDREAWLMRTLSKSSARLVLLLDAFDTVLTCNTAELVEIWRTLAGPGRILISTERQLWPEEHTYRGERLGGTKGAYPLPERASSLRDHSVGASDLGVSQMSRYINIGALLGSPLSIHGLFKCMQERYASFPHQCPIVDLPNGSYQYVSTAPFKTRRIGVVQGHWGWEQSCFHMYLMEQVHGALPSSCPDLVLDYSTELMLNLNKLANQVRWPWGDAQPMRSPFTGSASCVLHANGAAKFILPLLHFWWDHIHAPDRSSRNLAAKLAPNDRKSFLANFSTLYVHPWFEAVKPQRLGWNGAMWLVEHALKGYDASIKQGAW